MPRKGVTHSPETRKKLRVAVLHASLDPTVTNAHRAAGAKHNLKRGWKKKFGRLTAAQSTGFYSDGESDE